MEKVAFNSGRITSRNQPVIFAMVMCTLISFFLSSLLLLELHAQTIFSGPAFGQIAGGVQVSTTSFEGMMELISSGSEQIILNRYWERIEPPLADDMYNRTPASAALGSNLFFDPSVTPGMMQQFHAPFTVLDFSGGQDPGNTIPPDPDLAVGPNHVITVQNAPYIRIFDKQGNLVQMINANSWFSTTIANPDPFNPSTTIAFDLKQASGVTLEVFNTLGQRVATLVNDKMTAGSYEVTFDASHLASGVYLYRLTADELTLTRKMMLMK